MSKLLLKCYLRPGFWRKFPGSPASHIPRRRKQALSGRICPKSRCNTWWDRQSRPERIWARVVFHWNKLKFALFSFFNSHFWLLKVLNTFLWFFSFLNSHCTRLSLRSWRPRRTWSPWAGSGDRWTAPTGARTSCPSRSGGQPEFEQCCDHRELAEQLLKLKINVSVVLTSYAILSQTCCSVGDWKTPSSERSPQPMTRSWNKIYRVNMSLIS